MENLDSKFSAWTHQLADHNGDGRTDILWHKQALGDLKLAVSDANGNQQSVQSIDPSNWTGNSSSGSSSSSSSSGSSSSSSSGGEWSGVAAIDAVYLAQKHVLEPTDTLFKLFSDLDALIKVNVVSSAQSTAPPVIATLTLNGNTTTIDLIGPATLPLSIPKGPGVQMHNFADSFTAILPKEWVQPGLVVEVQAGESSRLFDELKVGAPSKIIMTMFDVHYFNNSPGDYPEGWQSELEAKFPTSELELRRIANVDFPELIVPARRDVNARAVMVTSKDDYKVLTGLNFDGEQAAALAWKSALKAANGISGRFSLYYVNIYGAWAGGQAGGFGGVGNGTSAGVLIHELGHAFSIPHWGNNASYPYKGGMFGILPPINFNETHAGPTWGYDLPSQTFLPATVQPIGVSVGGEPGVYKKDPMQGGGTGDQEQGFVFRHFSDYSMHKMQLWLEGHIVIWRESLNSYASWNDEEGDYTQPVSNNGVQYPVERDVQVISVMAATSAVTPQATLVYPPIGPFSSGIIDTFDPSLAGDRAKADEIFCHADGCDLSLRVTQGGNVSVYMLRAAMDLTADPLSTGSLYTQAVNLRAADGEVTKIELLNTPDAEINGLPVNPTVMDSWEK